jgi:hypothetical protein
MFAAMQLGGEKEAIEQTQVGALAMARVSVRVGPVIDNLNVFNLPFLFRNTAHMQKVIDGRSARNCSTPSPTIPMPAWSACAGWMPRAQRLRHQAADPHHRRPGASRSRHRQSDVRRR